uniref:Uncharacterized protein n=1 Tax=Ditylenchus dipsaci TaxID=166011 RepID=A0A915ESE4_9BILA
MSPDSIRKAVEVDWRRKVHQRDAVGSTRVASDVYLKCRGSPHESPKKSTNDAVDVHLSRHIYIRLSCKGSRPESLKRTT